jgi:hypothetical protein
MISRSVSASGFGSARFSFSAGSFLVFLSVHFNPFLLCHEKKPDTEPPDMEGRSGGTVPGAVIFYLLCQSKIR